jgi:anion exchange protein
VAYLAQSRDQLLDGIDEFVDDLTVLPPSIWDPSTRMEPPQQPITIEKLRERLQPENRWAKEPRGCQKHEGDEGDSEGLRRTGRFFGGLVADIRRRWRWYRSDFVDGLHTQCIASTIFLYFACITPIVTFGGLMGQKTGGLMGTMETLLSGAICGVGWALFSGQPLVIVGATGPLLVFEAIIYQLCTSNNVDFLSLRLWVGVWVAVCLLLIVAFDLSFLVQYITRFTEESFAVLISVIFIYEAFAKIADIWFTHPVQLGHADLGDGGLCLCARPSHNQLTLNDTHFNVTELTDVNGTLRVQDQMYQWHDGHDHYHHADYERAFGLSAGDILNSSLGKLAEDCLTSNNKVYVGEGCLTVDGCVSRSWLLEGPGCESDYSADVFLLSVVLFIGTFALAMFCRQFRSTGYFPAIVRNMVGDFAVLLSVVVWSAIDFAFHINTPKLNVPPEFKPTNAERGWLINPLALTHWWLGLIAIFPALLATILIFLDQQITAVIVNRSEHKLKKGFGYHLDLLTLAVLITICSVLGLPWFVAATVRSITHVHSTSLSDYRHC